jgi:hypothetical protein
MNESTSHIRPTICVSGYFALWMTVLALLRTVEKFQVGEALAALAGGKSNLRGLPKSLEKKKFSADS